MNCRCMFLTSADPPNIPAVKQPMAVGAGGGGRPAAMRKLGDEDPLVGCSLARAPAHSLASPFPLLGPRSPQATRLSAHPPQSDPQERPPPPARALSPSPLTWPPWSPTGVSGAAAPSAAEAPVSSALPGGHSVSCRFLWSHLPATPRRGAGARASSLPIAADPPSSLIKASSCRNLFLPGSHRLPPAGTATPN